MSTLSGSDIKSRLGSDDEHKLVITPILSRGQIGRTSVDARLGNQFIVFRSHTAGIYSFRKNVGPMDLSQMQERIVLSPSMTFILHPGMLVLGSTLEYIGMPDDLEAQVEGRSSWARLGLVIATATLVEPGFHGSVTLEMCNVGTIPLELIPGIRVAQFVFRTVTTGPGLH